ncbi:aminotransferase class V-fold PLP-dependent enzyme [Candidatus Bathyarchaeota archaeon]|nr:aminotransferase class V-fold PLP-dependent enzyme [Candidatus Bathyarchaeota archaeon]
MSDKISYVRHELNLPDGTIAVNAGSWGPLCSAARKAIEEGYETAARSRGDDPGYMKEKGSGLVRYDEVIDEAKEELGRFLNCSPDEVALCDSTTTAMNIFLWGYDFQPGDEVVVGSLENPAALVPLRVNAMRRGARLVFAELGNGGRDATEAIAGAISQRTRMILISDVNYATGSRVDLRAISQAAHEEDILVLSDGIQAVGTQPVDVKELEVDGYAMARHKFLCGPDGAGALYVREEVLSRIHPTYTGVFSASGHGMGGEVALMETAQRYEVSTRPLPVILGGTASLRWLGEQVGWPYVFGRCRELYDGLWDRLSDISGVTLISERGQSSLLTFSVQGVDPRDVVSKLRDRNIFTRTISVTEPEGVRLSIGFWNRESDLDAIADAVSAVAA